VFAGLIVEAFGGNFSHFLGETPVFQLADEGELIHHHTNWFLILGSVAVAVSGVYFAYVLYGQGGTVKAAPYARRWSVLYEASRNKLYVDEIYNLIFVVPFNLLAQACRGLESLLYDVVRLIATLPKYVADLFQPMQNGLVQFYGLSMVMGVVAFIGYLILWAGK
jgi:NADH-quinone oxidoreductase subunit L